MTNFLAEDKKVCAKSWRNYKEPGEWKVIKDKKMLERVGYITKIEISGDRPRGSKKLGVGCGGHLRVKFVNVGSEVV